METRPTIARVSVTVNELRQAFEQQAAGLQRQEERINQQNVMLAQLI